MFLTAAFIAYFPTCDSEEQQFPIAPVHSFCVASPACAELREATAVHWMLSQILFGSESTRSCRPRLRCVRPARVRAVNGDAITSPKPTFHEFDCPFQPVFPVVPLVEVSHSGSPSWVSFSSFSGVRSVQIARTNVREQ